MIPFLIHLIFVELRNKAALYCITHNFMVTFFCNDFIFEALVYEMHLTSTAESFLFFFKIYILYFRFKG